MAVIIRAALKTSISFKAVSRGKMDMEKGRRYRLGHILAQVFTTRPKVENADAALANRRRRKVGKSGKTSGPRGNCDSGQEFGIGLFHFGFGKCGSENGVRKMDENTGGIIRRQLQLQASAQRVCLVSLVRQQQPATCNISGNVQHPAATSSINCVFLDFDSLGPQNTIRRFRISSFPRASFSQIKFLLTADC